MREAPVQQRLGGDGFSVVQSYKDLVVWRKAMELCEGVYRVTREFPKEEAAGMARQVRRSAILLPTSIAEGWSRRNKGDYSHSLRSAQGSAMELETELLLSIRLSLAPDQALLLLVEQLAEIQQMLGTMIASLQRKGR